MGKFFENIFTPLVYIQNDQHVMGIILRYVCWGTHRPPPPLGSPAADDPTHRPPRFGSTKAGGEGGLPPPFGGECPPPPLQPLKRLNTPRGQTLAGCSPRATGANGDGRGRGHRGGKVVSGCGGRICEGRAGTCSGDVKANVCGVLHHRHPLCPLGRGRVLGGN